MRGDIDSFQGEVFIHEVGTVFLEYLNKGGWGHARVQKCPVLQNNLLAKRLKSRFLDGSDRDSFLSGFLLRKLVHRENKDTQVVTRDTSCSIVNRNRRDHNRFMKESVQVSHNNGQGFALPSGFEDDLLEGRAD